MQQQQQVLTEKIRQFQLILPRRFSDDLEAVETNYKGEMTALQSKVGDLREQVGSADKEKGKADALQREMESCIETLKAELSNLKHEHDLAVERADDAEATIDKMGDDMDCLQSELMTERGNVLRLNSELTRVMSRSPPNSTPSPKHFASMQHGISGHPGVSPPPSLSMPAAVSPSSPQRRLRSMRTPRSPSMRKKSPQRKSETPNLGGNQQAVILSQLQKSGWNSTSADDSVLRRLSCKLSTFGMMGNFNASPAANGPKAPPPTPAMASVAEPAATEESEKRVDVDEHHVNEKNGKDWVAMSGEIDDLKQEVKDLKVGLQKVQTEKKNLQEEVDVTISGLKTLTKTNKELESSLFECQNAQEALQDEVEDLNHQLEVTETEKDDIFRQFNNQNIEMQSIYSVMERDKSHRQDLTAKLRRLDHVKKQKEKETARVSKELQECKNQLRQSKGVNDHVRDKLTATKSSLNSAQNAVENLEKRNKIDVSRLTSRLNLAKMHSQKEEILHASCEFISNVFASVSDRQQSDLEENDVEILRLSNCYEKMVKRLSKVTKAFELEKQQHQLDLSALKKERADLIASKKKVSVLSSVQIDLENEKERLGHELDKVMKKLEAKREAFNSLSSEMDVSTMVIKQMHMELDIAGRQKLAEISEKEVELASSRAENSTLENDLKAAEAETKEVLKELDSFKVRLQKAEIELAQCSADKANLMTAIEKIVRDSSGSLHNLDAFLRSGENAATKAAEVVKNKMAPRRRNSIFQDAMLGEPSAPLDLSKGADILKISFNDFTSGCGQVFNGRETQAKSGSDLVDGGSDDVYELCANSNVLDCVLRRVAVIQNVAAKVDVENVQNLLKLRICKKEFRQLENHWRSVNINLSKAAREESANLKKDLSKKKTLLVAARKMSEGMEKKIKVLQKETRLLRKKCDKNDSIIKVSVEKMDMAEEDARGEALRFQEVMRLTRIGENARKCIFNVMTSVWARNEESAAVLGSRKPTRRKNVGMGMRIVDSDGDNPSMSSRRHSALALGSSMAATFVSSLWLSPQQEGLENVLGAVDKVDAVLKNVQHVAASTKSELKVLKNVHKTLQEKHNHLSKWAEREAIRKNGLKDASMQFDCGLKEPLQGAIQTDVTWLGRVPHMRDAATAGGEDRIMWVKDRTSFASHDLAIGERESSGWGSAIHHHHVTGSRGDSSVDPRRLKMNMNMNMNLLRSQTQALVGQPGGQQPGGQQQQYQQYQQYQQQQQQQQQQQPFSRQTAHRVSVTASNSPMNGGGFSPRLPANRLSHWNTVKAGALSFDGSNSRNSLMSKAAESMRGGGGRGQS